MVNYLFSHHLKDIYVVVLSQFPVVSCQMPCAFKTVATLIQPSDSKWWSMISVTSYQINSSTCKHFAYTPLVWFCIFKHSWVSTAEGQLCEPDVVIACTSPQLVSSSVMTSVCIPMSRAMFITAYWCERFHTFILNNNPGVHWVPYKLAVVKWQWEKSKKKNPV